MLWFTSDTHFYHTNIIQYCNRPYSSVEEMNEALVTNWNEVVAPTDTVYHLGDFSLAARPVELFTPRLNGTKILVPGNHDWCHPSHKKSRTDESKAKWIRFYEDSGWRVMGTSLSYVPGLERVNICHLPYSDSSDLRKLNKFGLLDDGLPLLCGYVHIAWTKRGNTLNVGVDKHDYRPISLDRVKELLATDGDID